MISISRTHDASALPGSHAVTRQLRSKRVDNRSTPATHAEILIVDDISINRKLLQAVIGKLGFVSDVAVDGREAYEAALEHPYKLIIMDVNMPGVDGIEATRLIRQAQAMKCRNIRRDLRIIAFTASCTPETRTACLEAGMDAYLTKPLQIDELTDLVRQFV